MMVRDVAPDCALLKAFQAPTFPPRDRQHLVAPPPLKTRRGFRRTRDL